MCGDTVNQPLHFYFDRLFIPPPPDLIGNSSLDRLSNSQARHLGELAHQRVSLGIADMEGLWIYSV